MREWKVGRITLGLFLISIGALLALNTVTTIPIDKVFSIGWPILLIVLGIEVLAFQIFRKDDKWSFDGFSIFLIFIAGAATLVIYTVNSVGVLPLVKNSILSNSYPVTIEESLTIDNRVNQIEIDIPNADIQLIGTTSDSLVNISGVIRVGGSDENTVKELVANEFTVTQIGEKLIVNLELPNNYFNWAANQTATLAIEAPEHLMAKINVINGKVDAKNIHSGVEIYGMNLVVDVADITGHVFVKNTNGRINLSNIHGSLDATLTNGNIKASAIYTQGNISLRTVNGNIDIGLAPEEQVDITASTTNGRVIQNLTDSSEKNFRHTIGAGTHKLELRTTNGNIRIE
ncbi:DUF4097 family beta strand repeat-containing protein [Desulfuribacillus alkaliarsenatis]|uniref:Adhesin domain-containing protein n=1 Tax=Desulfuribacillus alkaliarsenatis TaxID=766136 RepID=A0A1E5G4P5_9FIRM|nr:DUF4097 family beta strand repeat-containing protein [Desulfuribacillus alkaliarsenatis]OEF98147.1 hypothetical protein BHF68_00185 [Desulfuribacillus alkaliarsenatis]